MNIQLIFALASMSEPSASARGRYSATIRMASIAMTYTSGLVFTDR